MASRTPVSQSSGDLVASQSGSVAKTAAIDYRIDGAQTATVGEARMRRVLNGYLDELVEEHKTAVETQKAAEAAVQKTRDAVKPPKDYFDRVKAVATALKPFFPHAKPGEASLVQHNGVTRELTFSAHIENKDGQRSTLISHLHETVPYPPELIAADEALVAAKAEVARIAEALLDARRKLDRVGETAKDMGAIVIRSQLEQNEDGRSILAAMDASIDRELDNLKARARKGGKKA